MKHILVYDVAASKGGALTVLQDYYERAKNDSSHRYTFVVSNESIKSTDNIRTVVLSWSKLSWIHRLFCDCIYMPKLAKQINPDFIYSLQNIGIAECGIPQELYVHNAIPFSEYRFTLHYDAFLWLYQNAIGWLMKRSIKRARRIVVQTEWMKNAVVDQCKIKPELIDIEMVKVERIESDAQAKSEGDVFFYPAAAYKFKNHQLIIEAVKILRDEKPNKRFNVFFTIDPNENKIARKIYKQIKKNDLPVKCIGYQDKEEIYRWYHRSVLVFPSLLETVGLPLLEAKMCGTTVLASNLDYAREAMKDYDSVSFFNPQSKEELASLMERCMVVDQCV